jgi:DNA-directed RNA polymerase subunit M/transcription elongation factor TFIIS
MNIETKTYSDGTTATGPAPLPECSPRHVRYSNVAPWECPKCGAEEGDRVDAERGRERDVPFNRCCRCGNEWEAQ